jgi:hypothetical protein
LSGFGLSHKISVPKRTQAVGKKSPMNQLVV